MTSTSPGTVRTNHIFYTTPVPLVVGVLNPTNSPHSLWNCVTGMNYASMTTIVTGAPTSCTVVLEGTLDGTNWSVLVTSTSTTGDVMFTTGLIPFSKLRARCTAVVGGTSPTVNVVAIASQTPTVPNTGGAMPMPSLGAAVQGAGDFTDSGWLVSAGAVNPIVSLNAQSAVQTGAVADFRTARANVLFQVTVAGAPSMGSVAFYGSADGITFVRLTTASLYGGTGGAISMGVMTLNNATNSLVAPLPAGSPATALRYFRADITVALSGGTSPTVTVSIGAY